MYILTGVNERSVPAQYILLMDRALLFCVTQRKQALIEITLDFSIRQYIKKKTGFKLINTIESLYYNFDTT